MSTKSKQSAARPSARSPGPAAPEPKASVIEMTRTYDAPKDVVWEVITDPKHVARWWGGPGVTNPVCEMDVRPGGQWHHIMRFPNGNELQMDFVFVLVEKPHKLAWQQTASNHPGAPRDITFTVTLEELPGDKTAWKLVTRFLSPEDRDFALATGFRQPIEASNERLAEYLKTYNSKG